MTDRNLVFFSDPGHGWLRVPLDDLDALDIRHKISAYSYHGQGFAYLEEDCDTDIYIQAAEAAGWNLDIDNQFDDDTFIRDLPLLYN